MKLDKSKPYGEIYGNCKAFYEQNHRFFNHKGEECDYNGKLIKEENPKDTPKKEDKPKPGRPKKNVEA